VTGMLADAARRLARRYPTLPGHVPHYWLFCSRAPLRVTLQYLAYVRRCRRAYPRASPPPAVARAAADLRRDGYVVLPPGDASVARGLAGKVDRLIGSLGEPGTAMGEDWMIQLPDAMGRVPDAVELLRPDVVATLEAYYRSYFKIFCVEIYRLVPTAREPQLSSLWHIDNYPPGLLKVFVYLTDCDRKTGALRLNSRPRSRRLIRSGFFDRHRAGPFREALERDAVPVEGPAGTVIIWDQNLVHRACAPEVGLRDAVSIKLLPSREPWRRHLARMGDALSYERRGQYPLDPEAD
jgi:hypothetical protein